MNVAVIDSGGANLGSVVFALERLGASVALTRNADRIRSAERVILPGVGAARPAMRALELAGLVETVRGLTQPVLGICLGLQLLFEFSEEDDTECLGIIPGRVTRLDAPRLPHMGWSRLEMVRSDPLLEGLGGSEWFYFIHGFVAVPIGAGSPSYSGPEPELREYHQAEARAGSASYSGPEPVGGASSPDIIATCRHGVSFAAVVRRNNFAACQFHPERSAAAGARILENFLRCK